MSQKIDRVEGIGPSYAETLGRIGITRTSQLLEKGATRPGRQQLADQSGIAEKLILKWVNMCDLFRIKGVAGQYAELLEAAGVDTTRELRNRNTENLTDRMNAVNAEKKLVRQTPSAKSVAGWISQARDLPPVITY